MPADSRTPGRNIAQLATRWRVERRALWGITALMTSVATWLVWPSLPFALAAAALSILAAAYLDLRRPITPLTVAQHLDRTAPTLEESASLLLEPQAEGDPIRRLQRRRTAAAFEALDAVPRLRTPRTRQAVFASAAALLLAGSIALRPERAPATTPASAAIARDATADPPALGTVTVQWTPPAYLRRPARTAPLGNVSVEESSIVQWHVTATGVTAVRIVDLLGDTVVAVAHDDQWVATDTPSQSRVWRVEAVGAEGSVVRSDAYLLNLIPDRAPVIAITAPPGRTEMEWTEPHRVVVRAVVSDDHAIGETALLATVAAGRGEGVRFRERRLSLERESVTNGGEWIVSTMVDLDQLAVEPGDEVYLAVVATDRRAPVPQVAHSETVFLAIRDTLDPVGSDFGGIAIDVEPEFFRSQRQIILDTESLLAEVRAGRVREPLPRAMEIGYDQYLLRVRYGEIAGQEDEGGATEPGAAITEADLMHQHDTEGNATRLAATVKATLQDALSAMWEAEKQLRTGHPSEALPHEYRALVALEQIRQAQRAYVKRIGFEPPAIDVARTRLTKDAKEVASLDRRRYPLTDPVGGELRAALTALDRDSGSNRAEVLRAAGHQLASLALSDPTGNHLETLAALRRLIDGDTSALARESARRGMLAALPVPARPIIPNRTR